MVLARQASLFLTVPKIWLSYCFNRVESQDTEPPSVVFKSSSVTISYDFFWYQEVNVALILIKSAWQINCIFTGSCFVGVLRVMVACMCRDQYLVVV